MFTFWLGMIGDKQFIHFFVPNLLFYGNSFTASLILSRDWILQYDEKPV